MRGHGRDPAVQKDFTRITPAGAGTCALCRSKLCFLEDHPRGCGDMVDSFASAWSSNGSPPRVRGHAVPECCRKRCPGITPAGAGTWYQAVSDIRRKKDHPRGCGDMSGAALRFSVSAGSPPRVRGHVACTDMAVAFPGITPAGAGTCMNEVQAMGKVRDHPRGCGDMPGI